MTNLDLPALREMMAKVMGWFVGYPMGDDLPYYCKKALPKLGGDCVMFVERWHPNQDLNQAFMLVEKMREKGYNFCLICRQDGVNIACFTKETNFSGTADEDMKPDPATAICLAIAKVMEESISN